MKLNKFIKESERLCREAGIRTDELEMVIAPSHGQRACQVDGVSLGVSWAGGCTPSMVVHSKPPEPVMGSADAFEMALEHMAARTASVIP